MTGEQHFRVAEELLNESDTIQDPTDVLRAAQIHATLALTAATYGTWTVDL
jgi:hypothetical protein